VTINKSGKWWKGTAPEDIRDYLIALAEDTYPVGEFRLSKCPCDSLVFDLEYDAEEGGAVRSCRTCKARRFICDSQEYWDAASPATWRCVECRKKSEGANVGVGFSLYEDGTAVRWLRIGIRCARCGVLASPAEWKIAYAPSLHLMDQV